MHLYVFKLRNKKCIQLKIRSFEVIPVKEDDQVKIRNKRQSTGLLSERESCKRYTSRMLVVRLKTSRQPIKPKRVTVNKEKSSAASVTL